MTPSGTKIYFVLIAPNPTLIPQIHILVKVKKSDVEDHAVLSHAVSKEEACTNLGPLGKPDDEVSRTIWCNLFSSLVLYLFSSLKT
jgi:hypothetical protein